MRRISYDVGEAIGVWRMSCGLGEAMDGLENDL